MNRRIPSTSSAVGRLDRSNIRHRSGAFDRRGTLSAQSERTDHTLTVQVEDTDDAERPAPTVLLVRRSRISARSTHTRYKPLPGLPAGHGDHESVAGLTTLPGPSAREREGSGSLMETSHTPTFRETDLHDAFSPVPLTPCPSQPERRPSDVTVRSAGVASALSSRLPTPDYPTTDGANVTRRLTSYFSRMQSLRIGRPAPPRTESEGSTYFEESTAVSHVSHPLLHRGISTVTSGDPMRVPTAIKDKRPLLLSKFSTTDKFTQKFPRPRSIKGLSLPGPAAMLEEDEGVVLERVERWTSHKCCLVLSVCTVLVYGAAGFVCALLTWFRAWRYADLMYVADYDILVLLTLASSILLLTALVGLSGALLNSRPLLAVYALLLWPALFSLLAIGYPAYKRYAFALDRKLSRAWSEWYTPLGRRVLQDSLGCCGFLTPAHAAAPSSRCYPRSPLQGCKGALWLAERENLATVWSAVFALVPVHLVNIFAALLCANHVTRTFGKGIMPKRYRLNAEDVRADAELLGKVLGNAGVRPLARPEYARASTSGVFREDKATYGGEDEKWEVDPVGLGICR